MGINLLENHFRRQYLSAILHLFAYAAGGGFLLCLYLLSVEHGYRPRLSIRGIVPLVGRWQCTFYIIVYISLVAGKEYGEGSESAFSRFLFVYGVEYLRVVIIQFWGIASACSVSFSLSVVQLIIRHFLVQKFADCLYLGKDKSSFRCLKVLGHD